MAKVEVRPLPKDKWHKKVGREDFARPKVIEALYDSTLGGHATGLTKEEEEHYGKLLGKNLSNYFNNEEPNPVWTSKEFNVVLQNHTMFFKTEVPKEAIAIKIMKASKYVANSMKEWEDGLWPFATHVIFSEEEDVELKATKIAVKGEIYAALSKMSAEEKVALVQLLSNKSLRGKSASFLTVELDELIEGDPQLLFRTMNLSKAERMYKATVLEAIQRQILNKDGSNILWLGDVIANDVDEAAKWLAHPDNQTMKSKILEKLQS